MEVHVPEHPIHTWEEFFRHIGIVTIGLLMALGLEQGAEAIHHHHQRIELREALEQDGERTISDADRLLQNQHQRGAWLDARLAQVRTAMTTHKALPAPPPAGFIDYDIPDMPAWHAARASGLLERLSQPELRAWSEIDLTLGSVNTSYIDQMSIVRKRHTFEAQYLGSPDKPSTQPLAQDTLQRYFDLLSDEASTVLTLQSDAAELRGAQEAVEHGERDVDHIQEAERDGGAPVNTDRQR